MTYELWAWVAKGADGKERLIGVPGPNGVEVLVFNRPELAHNVEQPARSHGTRTKTEVRMVHLVEVPDLKPRAAQGFFVAGEI